MSTALNHRIRSLKRMGSPINNSNVLGKNMNSSAKGLAIIAP